MKANIASLSQGFTFCPDGRSGFIFFRRDDHVLELYWDMSGVDDFDILPSLEGASRWVHPEEEQIEESDRRKILDALEIWLASKKIRSDAFGPVKRPL